MWTVIGFEENFYGLASTPKMFSRLIWLNMRIQNACWQDDTIAVAESTEEKHKEKLFNIQAKWEGAGYRPIEKNLIFLKNNIAGTPN